VRALRGLVVVERGVRGRHAEEGVGVEVAEEGLGDEGPRGGGRGGDVEAAAGERGEGDEVVLGGLLG
jgi:hypothetical protein